MKINASAALAASILTLFACAASAVAAPRTVPQVSKPVVGSSRKPAAAKPAATPQSASKAAARQTPAPGKATEKATTATAGRQAAKPTPAPPPRALTAEQEKRAKELGKWLASIPSGYESTPEQKAALRTTLLSMSTGPVQPDPRIVEDLCIDLAAAMTFGGMSPADRDHLANDVCLVLNSGGVPVGEVRAVIDRSRRRLQSGGVTTADVQKVIGDLTAISHDLQRRHAAHTDSAAADKAAPPRRSLLRGALPAPRMEATPAATPDAGLPRPRTE